MRVAVRVRKPTVSFVPTSANLCTARICGLHRRSEMPSQLRLIRRAAIRTLRLPSKRVTPCPHDVVANAGKRVRHEQHQASLCLHAWKLRRTKLYSLTRWTTRASPPSACSGSVRSSWARSPTLRSCSSSRRPRHALPRPRQVSVVSHWIPQCNMSDAK